MPSLARPYQACRFVSQKITCEHWLITCTLNPETHSSISSQRSHVSFCTTIASVALMLPWQDENRAAWSIASIFQSSTLRSGS